MREAPYLRWRYRAILSYVGLNLGFVGLLMLSPLLTIVGWDVHGGAAASFILPALTLIVAGFGMWRLLAQEKVVLTFQEGGVIVVVSWLIACVAAAIPFIVVEDMSVTHAAFEAVSGWSTTGLSVVDVENASKVTLMWRSIMQFAGGAGFAIVMLSALTGGGGPSLSAAEGRADQLTPNVRASAALVLKIYIAYAVIGVVGLKLAGMDWFDAVNHAFCAISTAGFSTKAESIGYWDSAAIEAVTIVLMLLGSLNFITAWCLLRRKFRAGLKNSEVRFTALLIPVCAVLLLAVTCIPLYESLSKAVRVAIFETVTALTTTGFSTVGYGDWNSFGIAVMLPLMLIGGATCSTAGGIKQYRIHLLFRSVVRELRRPFLPRTVVIDDIVWEGEDRVPVTDTRIRTAATYVFLFLCTWLIGAAVMAAHDYSLRDSLFESASTLGTVGLSVGVTSADTPGLVLWTQIAGMLLGRLEFFVIIASVVKIWRDGIRMARP
jgi:trk system potassium uptake protein TrkH